MAGNKGPRYTETERKILNALQFAPKLMLRWKELRDKTGLSSRTLSLRLKHLQEKGKVRRVVETKTEEYPPPVYYQLIGDVERKFAALIQEEWTQIRERLNELAQVTHKDPEAYLGSALEAIMVDVIFTLYYASTTPRVIGSALLMKWHNDVHQEVMWNIVKHCATSKEYQKTLKQIYENARKDLEEISKQSKGLSEKHG